MQTLIDQMRDVDFLTTNEEKEMYIGALIAAWDWGNKKG